MTASGPDRPGVTLANWDLGGEPSAWAYLHAGELLPSVQIPATRPVAELELAEQAAIGRFAVQPGVTLDDYVARGPVSGIVVVLGGRIVYQRYPRMRPGQRHFVMSVTKAFTSALVGILEQHGVLDLSQPVDAVITELAGSGWAGVPARDVLGMASGIDCLDDNTPGACTDPDHPFYRFEATLGWRPTGDHPPQSPYEFVTGLRAGRPPGERYEYVSVNTFVLSWLIERVTALPFAEVLGREIWRRAGFEAPAQLSGSATGAPGSHGGLSIALRDLARFGMLFTPSRGRVGASDIITAQHLRLIQTGGRPELHRDDPASLPGYVTAAYGPRLPPASRQWNFAMPDGDLFKGGYGGQGLYVSPARDLVIAFTGIPRADGSSSLLRWFSRRLALSIG